MYGKMDNKDKEERVKEGGDNKEALENLANVEWAPRSIPPTQAPKKDRASWCIFCKEFLPMLSYNNNWANWMANVHCVPDVPKMHYTSMPGVGEVCKETGRVLSGVSPNTEAFMRVVLGKYGTSWIKFEKAKKNRAPMPDEPTVRLVENQDVMDKFQQVLSDVEQKRATKDGGEAWDDYFREQLYETHCKPKFEEDQKRKKEDEEKERRKGNIVFSMCVL